MKRKIIIIGGGASGLVAAICGAREGAGVTIVEHMDRVGKKILSTGNGRCNMTNLDIRPECYRCGQPAFPMKVLERFTVEQTLEFFRELGIETRSRGGYIYPGSDQASAVLDVLRREVERLGVVVLTGCEVREVSAVEGCRPRDTRFVVKTSQGDLTADAVILAAGSKAAPNTGSDGSGYELAKGLGHKVIRPLPALVQLRCQGRHYKQLAGIRTEAHLSLYADGSLLAEDTGELQLTDYGLSGIPTFQISRFAARALDAGQKVTVRVDFLPSWPEHEAFERLRERAARLGYKTAEEMMVGLLNRKLAAGGRDRSRPAGGRTEEQAAFQTAGTAQILPGPGHERESLCQRPGLLRRRGHPAGGSGDHGVPLQARPVSGGGDFGCGRHLWGIQPAVCVVQRSRRGEKCGPGARLSVSANRADNLNRKAALKAGCGSQE